MYKDRKKTTHEEIGERTYINIYKEYKYNICQNGHKTHVHEKGIYKREKRKRYI